MSKIIGEAVFLVSLLSYQLVLAGTIVGRVSAPGLKDAADVVVYLEGVKGEFPSPGKPAIMDQQALTFIPHVLPVLKGTTVDFLNSDLVYHNVFSPSKIKKFNLGRYEPGQKRSVRFDKSGVATILCNIHTEMEAYIVVLDNPYFSLTQKDGKFNIDKVPVGSYKLSVWHPRGKGESKEVKVPEEGEVTVELELRR